MNWKVISIILLILFIVSVVMVVSLEIRGRNLQKQLEDKKGYISQSDYDYCMMKWKETIDGWDRTLKLCKGLV